MYNNINDTTKEREKKRVFLLPSVNTRFNRYISLTSHSKYGDLINFTS